VRGLEDGEAIVDCGGTIVRAVVDTLPSPDAAVTLTTRPERMRFADAAAGTVWQNRTWATVTETIFAGERCRYLCQCDGGVSIVLKESSSAAIRRRVVGERVEVAWSIADTVIV
jgi:hypothetical protein